MGSYGRLRLLFVIADFFVLSRRLLELLDGDAFLTWHLIVTLVTSKRTLGNKIFELMSHSNNLGLDALCIRTDGSGILRKTEESETTNSNTPPSPVTRKQP